MRAIFSGYLDINIAFHLTLDVRKCYATPVIRHMTYIPSYNVPVSFSEGYYNVNR